MRLVIISVICFLLSHDLNAAAVDRWYGQATMVQGTLLFRQNCAVCHGANAEGTPDWKKSDANGNYPPPPLNGSAHAWHHSIPQLARSIKQGGIKIGGVMPGFAAKLTDQDILAVIAFFQSQWPDGIYQRWHDRHMQ